MKFMEGDDDEVLHDYFFGNMKVKGRNFGTNELRFL